jgi:ferredoxin
MTTCGVIFPPDARGPGRQNESEYGLLALMISKIEVIDVACIGCGTCWVACPQAFKEHDIGDDLKALPTGGLGDQHIMRAAAEGCPTLAISLIDEAGVVLFPSEEARAALNASADW